MATYYVRPTNGSDAAAGTSFATAWQTTQKAFDSVTAGDEIRLCNEATETPSATIAIDTNAGAEDNPIVVVGADSTDGTPLTTGFYTISGASLPASTVLISATIAGGHYTFTHVRFTAATGIGWQSGTSAHYYRFDNCRFDSHGDDGIYVVDTGGATRMVDCEIDNNTGQGIDVNTVGRGNFQLIGCLIHDNGSIGAEIGGDDGVVVVANCEIYDNGGDGLQLIGGVGAAGGAGTVTNCTIYGNTGDGLYVAGAHGNFVNNSSSSNTAYGFSFTATGDNVINFDYNHTYNNTSGASDITLPGNNNQTGDPLFASVTDGSEDFTPGASSPLKGNGIMGTDIGARRAADAGGAGNQGISQGLHTISNQVSA